MTWIDDVRQLPDELDDGHNGHIDAHRVIHAALRHWSPDLSGQGFPEGKVSAPVGTIYTDTQATAGAIRWIKTVGTGTTGWRVQFGDTGWRRVDDLMSEPTTNGSFAISRDHLGVHLWFNWVRWQSDTVTVALPQGYLPERSTRAALVGTLGEICGSVHLHLNGTITIKRNTANSTPDLTVTVVPRPEWPAVRPGTPY